jgi:hypothetical protein
MMRSDEPLDPGGRLAAGALDTASLYRAVGAELHRVDAGLTLVTVESRAAAIPVEPLTATILYQCFQERSLAGHADHAARALGIADKQHVASHLDTLVRHGLLQPVERAAGGIEGRRAAGSARLATVAIVTADRPSYLARCLESYAAHLAEQSDTAYLLVIDTSRQPANQRETARIAAETRAIGPDRIRYLGTESRRALRRAAIDRGLTASVVEWLLPDLPPVRSAGTGRNHLLLAEAGRPVLMVDDDTICEVWTADEGDDDLGFVGHTDPRETTFFPSRADAFKAVRRSDADLLAAHGLLLGAKIEHLAARSPNRLNLDAVCRHLLPALDGLRPAATVRATWSGIAGDAAVQCPYPILFVAGRTRDRSASAEEALRLALSSREVVRSVPRLTVTDEPWFMSYCAAVDNADLLPPFSPFCANEDALFGVMLRMCDPQAFVGQIPIGVLHDSARPSRYESGTMPSASGIRLSDLIQGISAPWASACVETEVSSRMRSLGRHLLACGRLEPRAWQPLVTTTVVEAKRRILLSTEAVLSNGFSYPPAWRTAIRQYQQAVLDSITSADMTVPAEYRACASREDAMSAVQKHLRAFGEALIEWPDFWGLQREDRPS